MMNKQTKMILGVAAVGVVGYFVYQSMKPKKANLNGPIGLLTNLYSLPKCGSGCKGKNGKPVVSGSGNVGLCTIDQYGPNGEIATNTYQCTGTKSTEIIAPSTAFN